MKIRNHDQLTAAEIHAARAIERRLRGPEPPRVPQCITCDATDGLLPVIVVHSDDSREAGRGVCQACVNDKWAIPDFEGNNHCRVEVSRLAEVIVNMTPHPVNIIDGSEIPLGGRCLTSSGCKKIRAYEYSCPEFMLKQFNPGASAPQKRRRNHGKRMDKRTGQAEERVGIRASSE